MSRWADDPERPPTHLIGRCLDAIDLRGRVLLANQAGALPALLAARGLAFSLWNRRLVGQQRCAALAAGRAVRRRPAAPAQGQGRAGDGGTCLPERAGARRPADRLRRQRRGHPLGRRHAREPVRRGSRRSQRAAMAASWRCAGPRMPQRCAASLAAWRSVVPLDDRRQRARLGHLSRHLRRRTHRRGHRPAARRPAAVARRRPRARLRVRLGRDRCRRAGARSPASRSICWTSDAVALEAARENVPGARARPRHQACRCRRARLRRHPVQPAPAQGHRRGPRVAGAAHCRCAGAPAPGGVLRSSCSGASRSRGCWRSTSPTSPWPPRTAAIASGGLAANGGQTPRRPDRVLHRPRRRGV